VTVHKDSGVRVPLLRDDKGAPICAMCGVPLAEVAPGVFQCAYMVELQLRIYEGLARAFDQWRVETP